MSRFVDFEARVATRSLRIAMVGLGYVGLPAACAFARAGFRVTGLELRADRVATIMRGVVPFEGDEPGLDALLAEVVKNGTFVATTDAAKLGEVDVILVAVETPVEATDHRPRYVALEAAVRSIAAHAATGALVIIESTIAPGTLRGRVRAWLEERGRHRVGETLSLGHCPERVMPGKLLQNLRTMSRVCGGEDVETANAMVTLYRAVVEADLDAASSVAAELTKTGENAFRDVNIAFANELARICEAAGADFLEVRRLINKSPGRNVLMAGTGVGGHCIPKDPWLLAAAAPIDAPLELVPAARRSNDAMPRHLASLVLDGLRGLAIDGAPRVLVLGHAYLEDSDDERNSPSEALAAALVALGCEVRVHDPHVPRFQGELRALANDVDAIVIAVAHRAYRSIDWSALAPGLRHRVIVDGRFVIDPDALRSLGYTVRALGRGPHR